MNVIVLHRSFSLRFVSLFLGMYFIQTFLSELTCEKREPKPDHLVTAIYMLQP